MRILLVHTHYIMSGGEDAVFEQECQLLKKDHDVEVLTFRNQPGFKGALQFVGSIWNFSAGRAIERAVQSFSPDVIHIHNWHFASGPIIIRVAEKLNVPIVMTLHNFRLLCPSGTLLHNGKIFTDSLKSSFPWVAISKGVYRRSIFLTFWLSFVIWFHKIMGTWAMVDKYIVLTNFAKEIYKSNHLGIDKEKFVVKPNFTNRIEKSAQRNNDFLFVGRLSDEKGVEIMLKTFKGTDHLLTIAGTGPLENLVRDTIAGSQNIRYVGALDKDAVVQAMASCSALVFPSICFEGMSMTILEAFSLGTPVIASNLGSMASMIEDGTNGLLFEPNNSDSLSKALICWERLESSSKEQFYKGALQSYLSNYTPEVNLEFFNKIYLEL